MYSKDAACAGASAGDHRLGRGARAGGRGRQAGARAFIHANFIIASRKVLYCDARAGGRGRQAGASRHPRKVASLLQGFALWSGTELLRLPGRH